MLLVILFWPSSSSYRNGFPLHLAWIIYYKASVSDYGSIQEMAGDARGFRGDDPYPSMTAGLEVFQRALTSAGRRLRYKRTYVDGSGS